MKVELSKKEIEAIESGINKRGATEVVVKIESGRVVVLQVEKKKIV